MSFIRIAEHKSQARAKRFAKQLRKQPTSGEQILWAELRDVTRNKEYRFRRQHPIDSYIVDFVCLKLHLIVEVDGVSHDAQLERDKRRDESLLALSFETMRFTNDEVVTNRHGVVLSILHRADMLMKVFDAPHP